MAGENEHRGKLVVISGPSGVGKSTICAELVKQTDAFLSVSTTTRPQAKKEIDGKNYWFVSNAQFQEKIERDEFLEYAEVFGNMYGTELNRVTQALNKDRTVILEIDIQGGRTVKKLYPDATMIFVLPPNQSDLVSRMNGRAREDDETAKKRLDNAGSEIAAAWQYYNHMVINDNLEQAVKEIIQIIA